MLKKSPKPDVSLISVPDKATEAYVRRVLTAQGVSCGDSIGGGKGSDPGSVPLPKVDLPILLIVPDVKQGPKQISLAKRFVESGGAVFVWSAASRSESASVDDEWLLEKLLSQARAVTSSSLHPIAAAVRLLSQLGVEPPLRVQLKGKPNALVSRVSAALKRSGVSAAKRGARSISAAIDGDGVTFSRANQKLGPFDISASMEALSILRDLGSNEASLADPEYEIGSAEAYSIARPPARLLSEVTSKRLLSCFGIALPNERLCKSAAQASSFAASFAGPAVIKLARPAFDCKSSVGAVRFDVSGHAAVRREVASLELLGRSLGPPAPLGYLVSEQVAVEERIWLKLMGSPKLGRVLLIGPGDSQTGGPTAAVSVPATATQAGRALREAVKELPDHSVSKLAVSVARFSRMIHKLDDRIDRAEITPLATVPGLDQAVALDALIGVSGRR